MSVTNILLWPSTC